MSFGILRHVYNLLGGQLWLSNFCVGPPNAPVGAVQYKHAVGLQAFVGALNIDAVPAGRRPVREEFPRSIVETVEALAELDILEIRRPWTDPVVKRDDSPGKINTYEIKHYLVGHFGRVPLMQLGTFEIQVWLNNLATKYSQSVVRHCYSNIRSITHMAKKMNFLTSDPAEDVNMPQTKPVDKPQMTQKQILALIGGIQDLHDLCLMYVGIFCGPRASEVMGLQWKSWTGTTLVPHGTAFEGQFYPGRFKTRSSRAPIGVPEQVRPIIEAWKKAASDPSPEALMFPTFGRGERTGQAVPRWGKNFLRWRVRPIAQKLGIPDFLITFQVMRRTLGTDLQEHGTLKDAQGALRHASIRTTGDVYMQTIESSVLGAMNSRTKQILAGKEKPVVSKSKMPVQKALVPKARRLASGIVQHLDQVGPSFEGRGL